MTNIEDAQEKFKIWKIFEEKDSRSAQKNNDASPDESREKKANFSKSLDFFLRESEIFFKETSQLIPAREIKKSHILLYDRFLLDWKFDHGLVHLASPKKSLWQKILESLSWIQSTSRPVLVLLDNIV